MVGALIAAPAFAQTSVVTEGTPTVTEVQTDGPGHRGGAASGAASRAVGGAAVGAPVGPAGGAVAGGVVGEDALTPETRT